MDDTKQAPGMIAAAFADGGRVPWRRDIPGVKPIMLGGAFEVAIALGEHACYEPDRVVVRPHDALPYTWVAEAFKGDTLLVRKSADSPREAAELLAKLIR